MILVLVLSVPAQAATKKVTAASFEEGKKDYPSVKTGTCSVALESFGCIKFTAKKAGTYKFTLKNYGATQMHNVSFWKNKPLPDVESHNKVNKSLNTESSAKYKLKKGDSMYIAIGIYDCGMPTIGNVKLTIKKVK